MYILLILLYIELLSSDKVRLKGSNLGYFWTPSLLELINSEEFGMILKFFPLH